VRFPILAAVIFLIIPVVLSGLSLRYSLNVDYGIESFRIENHIAAIRNDAWIAARKEASDAKTAAQTQSSSTTRLAR
jgi:hypothetical protein